MRDAHRARLLVTPYTVRSENRSLPADVQRGTAPGDYSNAIAEDLLFEVGVDGLFTDNTDMAVLARRLRIDEGRPAKANVAIVAANTTLAMNGSVTTDRTPTPMTGREFPTKQAM